MEISNEAATIATALEVVAIVDKTMEANAGHQMMPVSDTADVLLDIRGLMTKLLKVLPKLDPEEALDGVSNCN